MKMPKFLSRTKPSTSDRPYSHWSSVDLMAPSAFPFAESVEVVPYARAADWFVDALFELSRISKLPVNWDTFGSPPLTDGARAEAIRVLTCLGRQHLPLPDVAAVSGGGVQFEWNIGPRALELEVLPDGSIEFLRAYEDDRMSEGTILPGRLDKLREQVSWLTQHPA